MPIKEKQKLDPELHDEDWYAEVFEKVGQYVHDQSVVGVAKLGNPEAAASTLAAAFAAVVGMWAEVLDPPTSGKLREQVNHQLDHIIPQLVTHGVLSLGEG